MTKATYEFEYAMKRLKDAIDYAQETGIFVEARLWSLHVEAAYNADIEAEKELTQAANAGAKLMHSLATGGESRLDADMAALNQWQDEPLSCGHSSEHLGGFGGCNPNGSCMICEAQKKDETSKIINLNGYKATATASWRERHLNGGE